MEYFVAHLHPLVVHLPIGILLLAAAFAWMARLDRYRSLSGALPLLLRMGAVAAIFSSGTGWLLGAGGEYDARTVQLHQWLGIATTMVAVLASFLPGRLILSTLTTILLIATGHFGGTLTHGEGYLAQPFTTSEMARPADVQAASVYAEIITPIFKEKCTSCHGGMRQKGGLRLDEPDYILKGGKHGEVLKPDAEGRCELLRRCLLPAGNDDHMPPREKPQLTPEELEILRWWIAQGADFQKKTNELPQTEMIRRVLLQWQTGGAAMAPETPRVPAEEPAAASDAVLDQLRQMGLIVLPVSRESHWLSVQFTNLSKPPDSVFVLMEKINKQIVWLQMSGCVVPEKAWNTLGKLSNLTRLSLDRSSISDAAMPFLGSLQTLQYLNLGQTQVTDKGLAALTGLKNLQTLFLYRTESTAGGREALRIALPRVNIDTGAYSLPFLETDTARLKESKSY